jgi:hypothetical protein
MLVNAERSHLHQKDSKGYNSVSKECQRKMSYSISDYLMTISDTMEVL